jgi:hypothetical protein
MPPLSPDASGYFFVFIEKREKRGVIHKWQNRGQKQTQSITER